MLKVALLIGNVVNKALDSETEAKAKAGGFETEAKAPEFKPKAMKIATRG